MATQSYNLKVKNTFLEVDVDDDTRSSISLDDDEAPKRQMTEPVPYTVPLLADIPQPKLIHSKYGICYFERQESSASSEFLDASTAASEHDIKDSTAERLDESTDSSEQDVKESTESLEHYLQSECEPSLAPYTNGMARQVVEEFFWNVCNEKQWKLDMEQSCISPHFSHSVSEQYALEPRVHTIAADALLGNVETPEDRSTDRRTSRKKERDADGNGKAKMPRRRKYESLIDIAARKQKQQLKQEKHASQQRSQQAPQSQVAQYCPPQQRSQQAPKSQVKQYCPPQQRSQQAPKSQVAQYCSQCGGKFHSDYKFCKFCGLSVSLSLLC